MNDQSCQRCGGPHQFDTSLPSPLWNQVVREQGWPEFLCTTCIVLLFVRAEVSFEAELYGDMVNRAGVVPIISVRVGTRPLDESYGHLQARLRDAETALDVQRVKEHSGTKGAVK